MKTYSKLLLGSIVLFTLIASSSAFAVQPTNLSALLGTWVNVNPNTRGTVKVVVTTHANGTLHINTYGSCVPTLCNHGSIHALRYSRSIGSNYATGLTAKYFLGFKTRTIDAYRDYSISNGSFLRLNSFNKYAPADTRKDYYSTDLFKKL